LVGDGTLNVYCVTKIISEPYVGSTVVHTIALELEIRCMPRLYRNDDNAVTIYNITH